MCGVIVWKGVPDEYQVLGSTSIPARLDTLVYWEPFSWLTSVGTTRNTVIRLGWNRIGLAVLILHAAGVGLKGRPAVISGRNNKCHSLQLQNHYTYFPPLQHSQTFMQTQLCRTGHERNGHRFRGIVCWPCSDFCGTLAESPLDYPFPNLRPLATFTKRDWI